MSSHHVLDLTHPLVSGQVPACHGHPCFRASLDFSLAKGDFANVHALTLGTHTGTHLDAPYHFFTDGATVDRLDLTLLAAAPAVVADVRHRSAHERITWADLVGAASEVTRRKARVLLLCTGWSRNWAQPNYSDHPYLDPEAARQLLGLGVRVIGLDTLSPDEVTPEKEGADVHRVVLGSGGIIVENMARLDALVDSGWRNVTVSLLPLSLNGCDGSPLRAVAWEGTAVCEMIDFRTPPHATADSTRIIQKNQNGSPVPVGSVSIYPTTYKTFCDDQGHHEPTSHEILDESDQN